MLGEDTKLTDELNFNSRIKQGSFCIICGDFRGPVVEVRKHMFEKHYDYVLYQMGGDKQKLQNWMELKE